MQAAGTNRIHLLSWSSLNLIHLQMYLADIVAAHTSSLCLKLFDVGTTIASSCQALRTCGRVQPGVCALLLRTALWIRELAEPQSLSLAHNRGSEMCGTLSPLRPFCICHHRFVISFNHVDGVMIAMPERSGNRFSGLRGCWNRGRLAGSHEVVGPRPSPLQTS
jgi:hypothetical protein